MGKLVVSAVVGELVSGKFPRISEKSREKTSLAISEAICELNTSTDFNGLVENSLSRGTGNVEAACREF